MWYGVSEYLIFVSIVASILHGVSSKYCVCTFGGAAVCSILNLVHETIVAGGHINIGWGPPMFVVGATLAFPVCALVGLPFFAVRRRWSRLRTPRNVSANS